MNLPTLRTTRRREQGFSLVELLVTIVVSLLASLAIFGVLSTYEAKKRTTTFVADASQSGNYAMFYIDKLVRNAGSGFAQAWSTAYGCQLYGYNSAGVASTTLFPSAALPTEFSQVQTDSGGNFVLAPVLIDYQGSNNQTSDALVIMSGNAGNAEYPVNFTAVPTSATALPLTNTIPFLPGDLLLLTDTGSVKQANCILSQVSSSFAPGFNTIPPAALPLAGPFYKGSFGATAQVINYGKVAQAVDLGSTTSDSPASFDVIGVNANNSLVDFPLLTNPAASLQIADNVLEMHALYGVDETGSGNVTAWESPNTAAFKFATLSAGLPGAAGSPGSGAYLLERIKAIRVGLILRTDLPENTKTGNTITAGPIQLFTDLPGLTYTRTLSGAELGYRYRTVETTIPVRNNLLIVQ
jgi:type IV pilus assembly protein PilW